jgi:uncharacterized damage-inducible protein DinB
MLKPQLSRLAAYNYWANDICISLVLEAGEEKADMVQLSSFPTIRKTIYHIWDAELVWISRLLGETPLSWPPSGQFNGTLQAGLAAMLQNSKRFIDYTDKATEESLKNYVNYHSIAGKAYTNTVTDMITHCMNHSTYHRGQLITMLRGAGQSAVASTDYIAFCRLYPEPVSGVSSSS